MLQAFQGHTVSIETHRCHVMYCPGFCVLHHRLSESGADHPFCCRDAGQAHGSVYLIPVCCNADYQSGADHSVHH